MYVSNRCGLLIIVILFWYMGAQNEYNACGDQRRLWDSLELELLVQLPCGYWALNPGP